MNVETIAVISSLMGAAAAALTTLFIWLFKARESDINLQNSLTLLEREILDVREDIREIRVNQREGAARFGKRTNVTRAIIFKLINHFNTEVAPAIDRDRNLGFKYVDVPYEEMNE